MNRRSLAALLLAALSIPLATRPADADQPARSIRVAVQLTSQADNVRHEQWLLDGVRAGLKVVDRSFLVVATGDADAVVGVSYRLWTEGGGAFVEARVDDQTLHATLGSDHNDGNQRYRWTRVGKELGEDVGTVLKAQRSPRVEVTPELLIAQLTGRDPALRAQAAHLAVRLGPQARVTIPALLEVLGDERPLRAVGVGMETTPARVATTALVELGAHADLIAFFDSRANPTARANALRAIAIGRSPAAPDVILRALDDRNRTVRTRAAGLAGAYAGRRTAARLLELLEDRRRETRDAALQSLEVLAGKNFGQDVAAWRQWWAAQDRRR